MLRKTQENREGFTLLEMVVSMSIFMLFLVGVFGTYIQITDAQKKANLNREAVSEARELLSFISEETKEKAIDYTCYESIDSECREGFVSINQVNEIGLISKNGLERTIIRKTLNDETGFYTITSTTQVRENVNRPWNSPEPANLLHSNNLQIQGASFMITPNQDPFKPDLETATTDWLQYQPSLNVILNVRRKQSTEEVDENPIVFETAISSRIYNSF